MTYGYRRIWYLSVKNGFTYCQETIRNLMTKLGLKVTLYHRKGERYSSYKGHVGKLVENKLKQQFRAIQPLTVLHTDVTQVRTRRGWGYISVILDQASKEVISWQVGSHPDAILVEQTLSQLPKGITPISHSDQGAVYQREFYQQKLRSMNITPSMSRKGNCLDNAPIESFFSLLKREFLNRIPIESVNDLKLKMHEYVSWYNTKRISLNKKGMTPVEYRLNYGHHAKN